MGVPIFRGIVQHLSNRALLCACPFTPSLVPTGNDDDSALKFSSHPSVEFNTEYWCFLSLI